MYRDNVSLDKRPPKKLPLLKRLLRAYIHFDDKTGYSARFNWFMSIRFPEEQLKSAPLPNAELTAEQRKEIAEDIRRRPRIG
jgi:hypothetical protein